MLDPPARVGSVIGVGPTGTPRVAPTPDEIR